MNRNAAGKWLLLGGAVLLVAPDLVLLFAAEWNGGPIACSLPFMGTLTGVGIVLVGAGFLFLPAERVAVLLKIGIGRMMMRFFGAVFLLSGASILLDALLPDFGALLDDVLWSWLSVALYAGFAVTWGVRSIPFGTQCVRPDGFVVVLRLLIAALPIPLAVAFEAARVKSVLAILGVLGLFALCVSVLFVLLDGAERRVIRAVYDLAAPENAAAIAHRRARLRATLRGVVLLYLAACIGFGFVYLLIYAFSGG